MEYIPTDQERKAYHWCVDNDVKVHVKPKKNKYTFIMEVEGIGRGSGKMYLKEEIFSIQWKYYLYLYEKLKDV